MLLSPISFYILTMLSLLSSTYAIGVSPREACAEKYTPCSPPGATNSVVPPVGDALSGLYFDLVSSVNPQPVIRDMAADHALNQIQRTTSTICCAQGMDCRLLQSYSLAFCWDRFTTNYFLPDGSYGNIFTGSYNSSSGVVVNLVSGDIGLPNGQTGNIYSDNPQAKPATSLLPVPSPWTSRGLGAAIPTTELGAEPMYSITTAVFALTPSSLSFPSVTSTAGPTQTLVTGNTTGFLGLSSIASTGAPCGCGTRPGANSSNITVFSGGAAANHDQVPQMVRCAVLLACFVQILHNLSLI